ncbi:MAG: hypothetical protein A2600_03440 [Candidatus Lambdaproteobacteria bacterium RIFOXYD1_FULL_56_27]|uniref:General secretion pathway protein F n=1 Tax=Candidatus Lambdaproteobacteria bacterium RIFOXYD2_FULL_56_26 TaxID=1817773 RepID=A0A1F6H352_9PROT|nr:MAG: hypothetical protein A2426_11500 [Candidatus Lambdaproteobacteria bacterium RIFOXYC1_FULL_56_13]OGH04823.1 MAG: hypothetical protein A2557_07505 [Candidatus Lambdaproteobacteria bacterium RIFOXYD2_FULL_56_26]OGH09288.1 MAG: hypothetical protein A2600_03440 [Candidatus Lambdaproteobacteria bacterium RIFOXYD1_FULL_56_27]
MLALFEYQAVEKGGRNLKGKIDAPNLKQAAARVQSQGLFLVSITQAKAQGQRVRWQFRPRQKVHPRTITAFTRQFSVLAASGIPYDRALDILIQENQDPLFQPLLADIKAEVNEGSSLAAALESRPDDFPKMYAAMVRAGEAGGTLPQVLDELTRYREENEKLANKIQNAMIYPAIMAVLAMAIIVFMMTFILPKITPIFSQFDVALPLPTRIVIFFSELLSNHYLLVVLALGTAVWAARTWVKTPKGELGRDKLLLKLPVVGKLVSEMVLYRFCKTLGTLLSSGVELKEGLGILKGVMGNRVFEDPFDELIQDIANRGMDLSAALKKTGLFPSSVVQMVRVGEEGDQLEAMLGKVAQSRQQEVSFSVERLVSVLEPFMILVMAGMVGFIVLAVMLPLFQLNQLL